ncbi:Ti-type conjugative transfer relaxase TraA [Novosphingobium sp. 1529]|uniref:Ti-type conjugative transfer relaxase TraA n=1 Tax=Novosphingobium sp. 1529 TaxID=3156424 RepID=UPI0033968674
MAIYHFSAKVVSRGGGSSAVAAAAYRSADRLYDARLDRHHDFSNKTGVVHSEVMLPDGAPEEWRDRAKLWNDVEAVEVRKDAQLAREIEFAIPREMTQADGIQLARNFVQKEFVDRGMVADLNVHWDVGADGLAKPHAHVMLSMREVGSDGFGPKVRDWNRTELLNHWRETWAEHVNGRLAQLDIDARIDHRSLEAQGIALEPQNKIGPAAARMAQEGLVRERLEEHFAIARSNGDKILENPGIALDAITHQQATFTSRDLATFVHRHSEGKDQFDAVLAAVRSSPDLVRLGPDGRGEERFTSRAMLETEQRLEAATARLDAERYHGVPARHLAAALDRAEARGLVLSVEQRHALEHVTGGSGIASVIGYAGTGKSAMLGVAREAWEKAGYDVGGIALSGIAAENLENGSGIASRTIASLEHQWAQGRETLKPNSILVIDEAGMIGTRQMERLVSEAEKQGAKVVLVGDPQQLQAIEAGASFRSIAERHGAVEITTIRRQSEEWQRDATRQLATGRTDEALTAYEQAGHVHAAETREQAREELIDRWDRNRLADPDASRIILTHTNDEVRELNEAARERMRADSLLGEDVGLTVERGERSFASGDRVMFLKNERSLEVKNGTLGTVEQVSQIAMRVRTDDGRSIAFDLKDYAHIDHGYAATIHKAQGMTVDSVHVLATPGLDRHAAYVALSRHRDQVDLHYGKDDFADRDRLVSILSRERGKDMASDYARVPEPAPEVQPRRGIFDGLKLKVPNFSTVPERVNFDGHRLKVSKDLLQPVAPSREIAAIPTSSETREAELRRERIEALTRHAKAIDRIYDTRAHGRQESPEQLAELKSARKAFEELRPHGPRDTEAAYARDPSLASEAARGNANRAIRALQLETELRTNPELRADRFVSRWNELSNQADRHYAAGNIDAHKNARSAMANMARSLERDPQLESLLAVRKAQLGITMMDSQRKLGAQLAFEHGLDLGRGRGRGLGL